MSVDGAKAKVRFEDAVADRVDVATLVMAVCSLAPAAGPDPPADARVQRSVPPVSAYRPTAAGAAEPAALAPKKEVFQIVRFELPGPLGMRLASGPSPSGLAVLQLQPVTPIP